jgi:hypothetical protein
MQKIRKTYYRYYFFLLILGSAFLLPYQAISATNPYNDQDVDLKNKKLLDIDPDKVKALQLEADQVQFIQDKDQAIASGHVVVKADKTTLYTDKVELQKAIGEAVASGHVYVESPDMQVVADSAKYNLNTGTGEFENAIVYNAPFQIKGQTIRKLSETHIQMNEGFMTTCDHDEPHWRMNMKSLDVYQGDKAIANGVTLFLGKMPLMKVARFEQNLKDKPIFIVTPGYEKEFGAFLLSQLRLKINDHVKVIVYGDVRERTGFGEGVDVKYTTPNFGSGLLRTYYTYEQKIAAKHPWETRDSNGVKKGPTERHELYRIQWRHKWQIDRDTNVIWQYYKIHDWDLANYGFLKRYFKREYRKGADVTNYFLLTRNLPIGSLTFRVDAGTHVNPALVQVERIPEVQYSVSGHRLGESNFYIKSTDTYSNLTVRNPDRNHQKTQRFDTDNEISHPKKVGFIEFRPWVGGSHTYYSRTVNPGLHNVVRGQFKTGTDMTTHFYKVWNYRSKKWGVEINGLRHVITPSISYGFAPRPTIRPVNFYQFDAIDALDRSHHILFSLENKIQTKRNNRSVDLIRAIIESDYSLLKTEPGRYFGPVISILEFNPLDWFTWKMEQSYDLKRDHWNYANIDAFIHHNDKWQVGLGKRYAHKMNDELSAMWMYKINPKWKFKIDNRFILSRAQIQQENYILTRDLHEWEMDLSYAQERGVGASFLVTFRLKAFPNMLASTFSDSYNQRKAGSQNSAGLSENRNF